MSYVWKMLPNNPGNLVTSCHLFLLLLNVAYACRLLQGKHFNKTGNYITLRRICESLLPRKNNKYYMFVCVYVRVRTSECPGAWSCACACVRVALLNQHSTRMRHIVATFVAPLAPSYFSKLSHKRDDSRKKLLNITYVS